MVGPNGDIILPQVWETVIEPDWTVTMHMWPIPEKPKTPEPPLAPGPEDEAGVITVVDPKKKSDAPGARAPPVPPPPPPLGDVAVFAEGAAPQHPSDGSQATGEEVIVVNPQSAPPKKPRPREPNPGALAKWMVGSRRPTKALKAEKKPEVVQQHDECCVM